MAPGGTEEREPANGPAAGSSARAVEAPATDAAEGRAPKLRERRPSWASAAFGATLALTATLITQAVGDAQNAAREQEAFLREQRLVVYAEYASALLTYEEAMRSAYQGDSPPDGAAREPSALADARRSVVSSRGQVEILASDEIAEASSIAHQAHISAEWMLREWPRAEDGLLDRIVFDQEWRIGGEEILFTKPEDPLSCFAALSRLDFVGAVRQELGAAGEKSSLKGSCWASDDFLQEIFGGDIQVWPDLVS